MAGEKRKDRSLTELRGGRFKRMVSHNACQGNIAGRAGSMESRSVPQAKNFAEGKIKIMAEVLNPKFAKAKRDPFAGGRLMKAFNYLKDNKGKPIDVLTRALLKELGATCSVSDFNINKGWYLSVEQWSALTGGKPTAIKKRLKFCAEQKWIVRTSRTYKGKKAPTHYRLTAEAFAPYLEFLEAKDMPADAPDLPDPWTAHDPGGIGFEEGLSDEPWSPGDDGPWSRDDHNTMVAGRPKAPPCSPIVKSHVVPPAERRTKKEAFEKGVEMYFPADRRVGFVPLPVIKDTFEVIHKRFGIDTVRAMRARFPEDDLGMVKWDRRAVMATAERIYNEARKNPTSTVDELLSKYKVAR